MESTGSTNTDDKRRALPTIDDVAVAAGVSTATISRTLNDPERVSTKTRERVLAEVERLGYQPNFSAKALAASRTGTIGAIIPTMDNAIFARGLQAFQEQLGDLGYTLLVASTAYQADLEAKQVRNLIARGVDAMLLIGHDRHPDVYAMLENRNIPFVTAWTYNPHLNAASVGFDNRAAMRRLADQIIALGHRSLGVISAPRQHNDRARERVEGILLAASEAGIDRRSIPIIDVNYSIANGAEAFESLMQAAKRPTAVICGNDVLAVGALGAAQRLGMRVPQDVSITGFDDIELAQISFPPLTTVHVPHRKMGRGAARLLVSLIDGEPVRRKVQLDAEIIVRDSLDRPPAPG